MPGIRTIMNILALGSVMVDNPKPRRMIKRALCVVGLVILSAMLVGALLLTAIAYIYQLFLTNGFLPIEAGIYVFAIVFALTILFIGITIHCSKNLLSDVNENSRKPVPLTTHLGVQAGNVIEAFVDGILKRPRY